MAGIIGIAAVARLRKPTTTKTKKMVHVSAATGIGPASNEKSTASEDQLNRTQS